MFARFWCVSIVLFSLSVYNSYTIGQNGKGHYSIASLSSSVKLFCYKLSRNMKFSKTKKFKKLLNVNRFLTKIQSWSLDNMGSLEHLNPLKLMGDLIACSTLFTRHIEWKLSEHPMTGRICKNGLQIISNLTFIVFYNWAQKFQSFETVTIPMETSTQST